MTLGVTGVMLLWNLLVVIFTYVYAKSGKPCWFQTALLMRIIFDLAVLLYGGKRALQDLEDYNWKHPTIDILIPISVMFSCVMVVLCLYYMVWTCEQQKKKVAYERALKEQQSSQPLNHSQ